MPQETIDQHLCEKFSDTMHVVAQQSQARFRPWVKYVDAKGGDVVYYDGLGQVQARELIGRFTPVQFDEIDHTRRAIDRRRFGITLPIDDDDLVAKITDPTGDYAKAALAAMERKFDEVCYQALFADVRTGRRGETTITAATDGVLTVDATAGLTLAKLLEIKKNFIDGEVCNEEDRPVGMSITGDEHSTLQQISQLTSGDFSRQFSLEKGKIVMAIGMALITFGAGVATPIITVTGGVRQGFAMVWGALAVGVWREWDVKIEPRTDYYGVTQVKITGSLGATRTEGVLVQKVTTTD